MKNKIFIVGFCLLVFCCILLSCGPRVHKTYKYTISGTVYADKQSMKPLVNRYVYISDQHENDYTYGSSVASTEYSTQTNENGFFSITINGGKINTDVRTSGMYNVRSDSIVTGEEDFRKHNSHEEDTCWHIKCMYYTKAITEDIYNLHDLVIYLDEYPVLKVEPNVIRRNQKVKITSDVGLYDVTFFCLEDLVYNKNWQRDSVGSAYKWFYEYWFGKNGMPFDKTIDITLNIPDSVPAGYYRFRLFGSAYYGGCNEPDCIIQLVDDPADN